MKPAYRLAVSLLLPSLIALHANAQTQSWIHQLGTSGSEHSRAAASDGAGGVFVGGFTSGNLGGPPAGGFDNWVARYDGAGTQVWIRQFGTTGHEEVGGLAPDGTGGVFVASNWDTLGGEARLARYDSAGNQVWARVFGITETWAEVAAPDGVGGVCVGGSTGTNLAAPNAGYRDPWLARYDSAGTRLWIRQFGSGSDDYARAIACDGASVFVAGYTGGALGGPPGGGQDAWLARYDLAGNQLWIRQHGSAVDEFAWALAVDGAGGVFVALGFALGHYDAAGNQLWVVPAPGDMRALTADGSGGTLGAGLVWGGSSAADAWLARFDNAGGQSWYQSVSTLSDDVAQAIVSDGSQIAFVAGYTRGSLGGPYQGGGSDAWVARYDLPPPPIGVTFCTGTSTACPCGNAGATGHGCENSIFPEGGLLQANGVPSVIVDSVVLSGSHMPNAAALYVQGTNQQGGGQGVAFGDGLRCAGGSILRIGTKFNAAGASHYPEPGDSPVSIRGQVPPGGGTRTYQIWYRNAAAFCMPATFNLTNGLELLWLP